MKNTAKRLILFFLALPALTAFILFLPQYNHLGVIVLLSIIGGICGNEMRLMLARAAHPMRRWTILIPAAAPLLAWVVGRGYLSEKAVDIIFASGIIWTFLDVVFVRESELSQGMSRIGSRLLMLIYPGWFLWWTARLTWYPEARYVLLIFMLTVYLNDSFAWVFGRLFGKHKDIVAVSPGKSLEGFTGGLLTSVLVIFISARILPEVFPSSPWMLTAFGICAAFTTMLGDLAESALKRAVDVKDSGNIILGRGGMLDSVDSLLLTAPIFIFFLSTAV